MKPGYYLVADGKRTFISATVQPSALERLLGKLYGDGDQSKWWIDYCLGLDVHERPAWVNLDKTDLFVP